MVGIDRLSNLMHAKHIEQSSRSQVSAWEHLEGYRVGQQILNEVCQADGADVLERVLQLVLCEQQIAISPSALCQHFGVKLISTESTKQRGDSF